MTASADHRGIRFYWEYRKYESNWIWTYQQDHLQGCEETKSQKEGYAER